MVEVLIAEIQKKDEAKRIVKLLRHQYPEFQIDYDLDESGLPFPCGHTVLRIEGGAINSEQLISIMQAEGIECEVMQDKICH